MANHALRRKRKFSDSLIKKMIVITAVILSLLILATVIVSAIYISKKSSGGADYAGGNPDVSFNMLIFAYGDNNNIQAGAFMLCRIDSRTNKIYLTSLPTDTICSYEGNSNTLNEHLSYGGHIQAIDAVENLLKIDIDRYAEIELAKFEEVMDSIGGVSFDIPEQVSDDKESGLPVNIEPGLQTLTGAMAGAVFSKNDWGTTDKITIQENLACAIINQYMKNSVLQNAETYFNKAVNAVDTDISLIDFYKILPVLNSMSQTEAPAEVQHANGSYMSDGDLYGFVIDDNSISNLTSVYTKKQ